MDKREGKPIPPLAEVEMEVLDEGREWTRRQLEKRLQNLADGQGGFSPSQRASSLAVPWAPDAADDMRGGGGD